MVNGAWVCEGCQRVRYENAGAGQGRPHCACGKVMRFMRGYEFTSDEPSVVDAEQVDVPNEGGTGTPTEV